MKPKNKRQDETKEEFERRKESYKTLNHEDLITEQADFFLEIGKLPKCQKMTGNAKGWCACNCLSVFHNNSALCTAVARYCVDFWKKKKEQQDQTLIDWHRYAQMNITGKGYNYILPYAFSEEDDQAQVTQLVSHTICTSALCIVLDMSGKTHSKLVGLATATGSAQPHGNKGNKHRAYKDNSKEIQALIEHFKLLLKLGEVRATRLVRSLVKDGTAVVQSTRDDDDVTYLPSCSGY